MSVNFSVTMSVVQNGRKRPGWNLSTDLGGELSLKDLLEFTKSSIILLADQALSEEQANGFDKEPIVIVDGNTGKRVEDVSPLGKIEFRSRVDSETIITDAYDAILKRAVIGNNTPGFDGRHYLESNYVFFNGKQIATNMVELQAWLGQDRDFKDGDLIRFVNIQPYARRLERLGVSAGREPAPRVVMAGAKRKRPLGFLTAIPNGAYALAARTIKSKYSRNSGIKFEFVPGSAIGLASQFKHGVKAKFKNDEKKLAAGRTYLYPSIAITISGRGTT